jgi:hypothetical protein
MTKQYVYSSDDPRVVYNVTLLDPSMVMRKTGAFAKAYSQLLMEHNAGVECTRETAQAELDGREFTPVYWYYPKDGSLPVLTMWDVNEPKHDPYIGPSMQTMLGKR